MEEVSERSISDQSVTEERSRRDAAWIEKTSMSDQSAIEERSKRDPIWTDER